MQRVDPRAASGGQRHQGVDHPACLGGAAGHVDHRQPAARPRSRRRAGQPGRSRRTAGRRLPVTFGPVAGDAAPGRAGIRHHVRGHRGISAHPADHRHAGAGQQVEAAGAVGCAAERASTHSTSRRWRPAGRPRSSAISSRPLSSEVKGLPRHSTPPASAGGKSAVSAHSNDMLQLPQPASATTGRSWRLSVPGSAAVAARRPTRERPSSCAPRGSCSSGGAAAFPRRTMASSRIEPPTSDAAGGRARIVRGSVGSGAGPAGEQPLRASSAAETRGLGQRRRRSRAQLADVAGPGEAHQHGARIVVEAQPAMRQKAGVDQDALGDGTMSSEPRSPRSGGIASVTPAMR